MNALQLLMIAGMMPYAPYTTRAREPEPEPEFKREPAPAPSRESVLLVDDALESRPESVRARQRRSEVAMFGPLAPERPLAPDEAAKVAAATVKRARRAARNLRARG